MLISLALAPSLVLPSNLDTEAKLEKSPDYAPESPPVVAEFTENSSGD